MNKRIWIVFEVETDKYGATSTDVEVFLSHDGALDHIQQRAKLYEDLHMAERTHNESSWVTLTWGDGNQFDVYFKEQLLKE